LVTWHGFALNVTTDLSYFDLIVAVRHSGRGDDQPAEGWWSAPRDLWGRALDSVIAGFAETFHPDAAMMTLDDVSAAVVTVKSFDARPPAPPATRTDRNAEMARAALTAWLPPSTRPHDVQGLGCGGEAVRLVMDEIQKLPRRTCWCDIHCVTRWSRFDNTFRGPSVQELLRRAKPKPAAQFALVHAAPDYTTNLPLSDLDARATSSAFTHNGDPLTPEHGGPVRLLVPHLYFWKSAKWLTGIELLDEDRSGLLGDETATHARRSVDRGALRPAQPARMRRGRGVNVRDARPCVPSIDHAPPGRPHQLNHLAYTRIPFTNCSIEIFSSGACSRSSGKPQPASSTGAPF